MTLRGLYAITPEGPEFAVIEARVRAALEGGVAAVQYRAKSGTAAQRRREAAALGRLCRARGVPLIVNDDVELALAVDADGAHLGRGDGELAAARARLGTKLLGASCYDDLALARRAVAAGADYIAFGSVFPSPTKPQAVRAPLSLFSTPLPVPRCAIGGITLENAPLVIAAGAQLLAVVSDLFDAPDVRRRALDYGRLFT
ncbi:MAG TPA: thiamine phosphate synthase [Burkholderiales bacterium]|nr:thiamine phosphate synthase [Burkholderiales bacterium]